MALVSWAGGFGLLDLDTATGGFATIVERRRLRFFGPDKEKEYFASWRSLHIVDIRSKSELLRFKLLLSWAPWLEGTDVAKIGYYET